MGPILGGWLIDRASWRLVFFINAPLALIVLAISLWHVPESRNEETKPNLDWVGSALATLGLGPSVYGLIESSRLGFGAPIVFGAFLLGAMLLTLFVCVEARSSNPLLPLTLFRSANFTGVNVLTLFLYMALGGAMFFFPLNLIQVQNYSATEAGAAWLPFILIVFLLSRWSGGLVKRYGAKIPLTVGPAIAAVGYGLFMIPGAGGSYWTTFFPTMVVLGLGMALSVAPLTTTVMSAVPKQQAGISSGINNAVSRIAGLLGIAVLGIVMVHTFKRELKQRLPAIALPAEARQSIETQDIRLAGMELPPNLEERTRAEFKRALDESFVQGFGRIMLAALILALAAAITALMLIKD